MGAIAGMSASIPIQLQKIIGISGSKRIRSILVEEDARGFGVNEALGLPNILAFDPEQISGMQFVPSKTLAQDMDSALDGICTENIEMYCKAFQSMKRTYEEKMRVQIENL